MREVLLPGIPKTYLQVFYKQPWYRTRIPATAIVSILEVLLAHGADVNTTNDSMRRPLDIARKYHDASVLDFLVAHGAKPGAGYDNESTSLELTSNGTETGG
ncbi:hypothetical protein K458DRAFT_418800 [Lentithecium fluviatile CBS 122367]|uniref:Uncharacterized protein n=1 Tax=Lentithecium fluviatile CBS 122367 TaxID=1168545 RepID=A0A6G1IZZ3_9PLEO|nr:hypothetical protein K458DRAFT_418800 [Lentithecium fluviatile CBS 122367]